MNNTANNNATNNKWGFLGLSTEAPAATTLYYRDEDGYVFSGTTTPQYYAVRVRSNITVADINGTTGFYASDKSAHAVRLELEKKMYYNADWDVIVSRVAEVRRTEWVE